MKKFCIYWPYEEGVDFNYDYYVNNHLPLAKKLIGEACLGGGCEKELPDAQGNPPKFFCIGYLYFEDAEKFFSGLMANGEAIGKDQFNFKKEPNSFAIITETVEIK